MNRFLPVRVISYWLDYNKSLCAFHNKLLPHEYLFLAANTMDRLQLVRENLQSQFLLDKNNIGVFTLDTSIEKHPNIDFRLDSTVWSSQKFVFDFDKSILEEKVPDVKNTVKKIRMKTEDEKVNKFRELLKDPELIFQVKATISKSRVLLNKSQNNTSRFSYMKYRKSNGVLGNFESPRCILSKTLNSNNSNVLQGNNSYNEGFEMNIGTRPDSANTVRYKAVNISPSSGIRPKTGASLASTVIINRSNLKQLRTFRESVLEKYKQNKQ